MGRPLRAVYANSTYSTGVQEMSDSDIDSICGPIILSYIVNNPTLTYGTTLRINTAGVYDVSRGSVTDTRNGNIGDHPVSNTVITTYTLYQNERAVSPLGVSARPVHYVASGSEHRISEMADTDIVSYVANSIVQTMISGGQGGYYLGLTTSGPPATGTWVSYATLSDTYYNPSSALTTDTYTLWQRTTGTSQGTIRPLKISGTNSLIEMSDAEIQSLSACIGEYIRTTGIGQYALQVSSPGTGTWASRGTFVDKVNNLVDTAYAGVYNSLFNAPFTGTFTNIYTGQWTGQFTQGFTGSYLGSYAQSFTGQFTQSYSQVYTGLFTNIYTGLYTGTYAGAYGQLFTQAYIGSYVSLYSQQYAGAYANLFTQLYTKPYTTSYTGQFTQNYTVAFTGSYVGSYSGQYSQNYSKEYTGQYANAFTGQWTNSWTGTYTGAWTGQYQGTYAGAYQGTAYASASYNAIYTRNYLGNYTATDIATSFTRTATNVYSSSYSKITRVYGAYTRTNFAGSSYTVTTNPVYAGTYTQPWVQFYTGTAFTDPTGFAGTITIGFAGTMSRYTRTYTAGPYTSSLSVVYTTNRVYNSVTYGALPTLYYTKGEVAYVGTYAGALAPGAAQQVYGTGAAYTLSTANYTRTAYTGATKYDTTYGSIHVVGVAGFGFGDSGAYLRLPMPDIGTGAFTLEFYFKFTVLPSGDQYLLIPQAGTGTPFCVSVNGPAGRVSHAGFGGSVSGIDLTQWTHVAITRNDNSATSFWVNGVRIGTSTVYSNIVADTLFWGVISGLNNSTLAPEADLTYFRFVQGTEEYTSNFTPPTTPNLTTSDHLLYLLPFLNYYPQLDSFTRIEYLALQNRVSQAVLNLVDDHVESVNSVTYQDHVVGGTPWTGISLPILQTTVQTVAGGVPLYNSISTATFTGSVSYAGTVYTSPSAYTSLTRTSYGGGPAYTRGIPNQSWTGNITPVYAQLYTGEPNAVAFAPQLYRAGTTYSAVYAVAYNIQAIAYTSGDIFTSSSPFTTSYIITYTGGRQVFTGTRTITYTSTPVLYTNDSSSIVYTGRRIDQAVFTTTSYLGPSYTGTGGNIYNDANVWTGSLAYTGPAPIGQYATVYAGALYTGPTVFTGTFTGASYAGIYASLFTSAWTANSYTSTFTGLYTGGYGNAPYSVPFAGAYNSSYSKEYTRLFAGTYTGQWTGQWTQAWTGAYQGVYGSTVYNATYLQVFTGQWTGQWTQAWTGSFTGLYNAAYTQNWTGTYNTAYSGTFTGTYVGSYANQWTMMYANAFTQAYTLLYTNQFTGTFTGAYVGTYSGQFTQQFTQIYAGLYNNAFTGTFTSTYTKEFSGLTTQATTTSITYTLWVRTA